MVITLFFILASKSNPRMNDWEDQSLMILELPNWSDYRSITVDTEFTLNCEKMWTVFPKMDIDLELEEDKTILFTYSIVLPLVQKEMTIGIFVDNLLEVWAYDNYRKNPSSLTVLPIILRLSDTIPQHLLKGSIKFN